jgi:hypothetical protein
VIIEITKDQNQEQVCGRIPKEIIENVLIESHLDQEDGQLLENK